MGMTWPGIFLKKYKLGTLSRISTWLTFKLSTSIYDLVLIYVCHFHHHFLLLTVNQIFYFSSFSFILSRYSCFYLGSQHPRIFHKRLMLLRLMRNANVFAVFASIWIHLRSKVFRRDVKFSYFFAPNQVSTTSFEEKIIVSSFTICGNADKNF